MPSADDIGALALASRDREITKFHYTKDGSEPQERTVEPVALVPAGRAWFVVCWDLRRHDWRTFRVDRMTEVHRTGQFFSPRALPADSPSHYVEKSRSHFDHTFTADVVLKVGLKEWTDYARDWSVGSRKIDGDTTIWPINAHTLPDLTLRLNWIPTSIDYTVEADDTVLEVLRLLAVRVADRT